MGNHEYYGNASAQLAGSLRAREPRWHASRSRAQRFPELSPAPLLTLLSVDTSPWVAKYRAKGLYWGGLTPAVLPEDTCVPGEGQAPSGGPAPDSLRANATLHPSTGHLMPTAAAWGAWEDAQVGQLEGWLQEGLTKASLWTFVTGHHPLHSYEPAVSDDPGLARLEAVLLANRVPLWLNGHHHNSQWVALPGSVTNFVTSGAGSKVSPNVVDPGDGSLRFGYGESSFLAVTLTREAARLSFRDLAGAELYEGAL